MTEKEKELLLKDICARLPYGIFVRVEGERYFGEVKDPYQAELSLGEDYLLEDENVTLIPYLRPMSSMTEEEKKVVCSMNMISDTELNDRLNYQRIYVQNYTIETFDYFNERKLDYRRLIEKGLALEAPVDMYKTELV